VIGHVRLIISRIEMDDSLVLQRWLGNWCKCC